MPKGYRTHRRLTKKQPFWKRSFMIALISVVGGLSISGYLLIFSPFFQIQNLHIVGVQTIPLPEFQEFLWQHISTRVLLFSTRSLFLVDAQELQEILASSYPQIANIQIGHTIPNKIRLWIKERFPVGLWCKDETKQECYAIDEQGVLFAKNDSIQGNPYFLSPHASQRVVQGERAIEPFFLHKLLGFKNSLEHFPSLQKNKLETVSFTVLSPEKVHVQTSEGWIIFINPQENLEWQILKLKTVLEKEVSVGKRLQLEYIDLRFGDQAYVKYYEL